MSEFFYMGGYALYVWGSFGVTAALMAIELYLLRQNRIEIEKRVHRMQRMQQNKG